MVSHGGQLAVKYIYLPYDPAILLGNKNIRPHQNSHTNVQSGPKLETTQMSSNWRMNKQIVIYPYYHKLLLSSKKEQTTYTCNMDESQNLYTE